MSSILNLVNSSSVLVKCYLSENVLSSLKHIDSPISLNGSVYRTENKSNDQSTVITVKTDKYADSDKAFVGICINNKTLTDETKENFLRKISKNGLKICIIINQDQLECQIYHQNKQINPNNVKFILLIHNEANLCFDTSENIAIEDSIQHKIDQKIKKY